MEFLRKFFPFFGEREKNSVPKKIFRKKYEVFDVLTLGSAVRDVTLYTSDGSVFLHEEKGMEKEVFAFPYGGKISVDDGFFTLGGGAANSAVAMSKLGLRVGIYTRLGDDFIGEEIVRDLDRHGVDVSVIKRIANEHSPISFIIASKQKKDHVVFAYRGSAAHLSVTQEHLTSIKTSWYYLTALTGTRSLWERNIENIFQIAEKKNIHIAWNPGRAQIQAGIKTLKRFFSGTHILCVNASEARELVGGISKKHEKVIQTKKGKNFFLYAAQTLAEYGITIVVITNSAEGAFAYYKGKLIYQPATKTKATDTTGAGDGFNSSFTTGQIRYSTSPETVELSLRIGTINTDSLIRIPGAQEGLLSWGEIEAKIPKKFHTLIKK